MKKVDRPASKQRGSTVFSRGSLLFASLLLALMLAACNSAQVSGSVTTSNTSSTPTVTPSGSGSASSTPTVAPTHPAVHIPFTTIRMVDSNIGWGLTSSAIYRTTDGGATWTNVDPQGTQLKNPLGDFMNGNVAWVVAKMSNSANPDATQVISTTDGGQHWAASKSSLLSTSSQDWAIDPPHFVNMQDGWVEMTIDGGPGAGSEGVAIYRSTDGGQSWTQIANSHQQQSNGLTSGGIKSGISFKDTMNGWATGEDASNTPWLYVTHDGGFHWQRQGLSNTNNQSFYSTTPPVFIGNTGLLPVGVSNGTPGTMLYVSQNGGQSWSPAASAPASFMANSIYIVDTQHAWAITSNNMLYATSNGGQSWQQLVGSDQPLNLKELSFIDTTNGWAISSNNGTTTLLRTTDGGLHWMNA